MNMRLLGARTINDLVPEMVDASALSQHIVTVPQDNLFQATCKPTLSLHEGMELIVLVRSTAADHQAQGQQVVNGVNVRALRPL